VSNVDKLTGAGLIASGAALTPDDHSVINNLSDDEVNALVSVSKKLPSHFVQKHWGKSSTQPAGEQSLGIVF